MLIGIAVAVMTLIAGLAWNGVGYRRLYLLGALLGFTFGFVSMGLTPTDAEHASNLTSASASLVAGSRVLHTYGPGLTRILMFSGIGSTLGIALYRPPKGHL